MDGIKKFTPRVSKRILLFIAGLVWGFAGFRVFTLGFGDVMSHHGNLIITIIFAAVIFFVFFKFIFSKMFKKHTTRIVNSKLDKHCVFSFFDFKSEGALIFPASFKRMLSFKKLSLFLIMLSNISCGSPSKSISPSM